MKLHIWQESLATDDPASRGAAVWEYIAGAMAELTDMDERSRTSCLQALDEEFPFYQERLTLEAPAGSTARKASAAAKVQSEPEPTKASEPEDVNVQLQRLIDFYQRLPDDERTNITRRLVEAGVTPTTSTIVEQTGTQTKRTQGGKTAGLPLLVPEFQQEVARLGKTVEKIQSTIGQTHFKAGVSIHLIRSMQMLGLMMEQFLQLHPQVWAMWEKIVTNHHYTTSFHKPPLTPDEALAQFLLGAPSTKRADVGQMVAKTFYLAVAAVSAVEGAGKEFAAWFFDKFGPQNIESIVQYEEQGKTVTAEDYWKRYLHLAETYSSDELAEQFLNLLGRNMLKTIQAKKLG